MPPKKLKINPPRRRESERMKTRSASVASTPTTPVTATSASSAGDTIEVAHKSSDVQVEPMPSASVGTAPHVPVEGVKELTVRTSEELPAKVGETPEAVVAPAVQPPARDEDNQEMADEDDTVTEYDFENEKESAFEDDENDEPAIFKDTSHDVITISSDDEVPQESFGIDPRPWLKQDPRGREIRELMYCERRELMHPIDGDWETTEGYQEMLDREMHEYIKDFPLQTWVVGLGKAQRGLERMLARQKLRTCDVPIFQRQIFAAMGYHPISQPQTQTQPTPQHQHQSNVPTGHHQMPLPQHHAPQNMPPPHMMHHAGVPYGPPSAQMPPPPHVLPSNHPMQQVGIDTHGHPVYQPMRLQHHQRPPQAPPSRPSSLPQIPQQVPQKRASVNGAEATMEPYLPEKGRRKRQKAEPVTTTAPVVVPSSTDPSLRPPYPTRSKPATDSNLVLKSGKAGKRRVAEPSEFPWNRKLDFEAAKARALWTFAIYTPATLVTMDKVRNTNAKYIKDVDLEDTEKQRQAKLAKTSGAGEDTLGQDRPKRQKKEPKNTDAGESSSGTAADHHTFGNFCYATDADVYKAMALARSKAPLNLSAKPSVEELMDVAEMGQIDINTLDAIHICWNPAKKGLTQDLQQVAFTIRDSLLTRRELTYTPILTADAAECIIDFCPDLLWRDMLLRITSESPLRNKEVRDRMCKNGNWTDKATITKRIGSALGQKQPKYRPEDGDEAQTEELYYKQNAQDYANYQLFFGNGPSSRKNRAGQSGKAKRNEIEDVDSSSAVGSRPGSSGSDGSLVIVQNGTAVEGASSSNKGKGKFKQVVQLDGTADEEQEGDSDEGDAVAGVERKELDEVSVQSDGELDRLLGNDSD